VTLSSTEYYIGLMSGTSLDGLDGALISITQNPNQTPRFDLLASETISFPQSLFKILNNICISQNANLASIGQCQVHLAQLSASMVELLLKQSGLKAEQIKAIGSHGVTIGHYPAEAFAFTMQIGDGSYLAELTGIDVVNDFRMADMAAGGQGAPLVPPFHQTVLPAEVDNAVILNLGGIANITVIKSDKDVIGYDTGPANTLLNLWSQKHLNKPYDAGGHWAKSGKLNEALLRELMQDVYFSLLPPKSSGKERFNMAWLENGLASLDYALPSEDVQNTLTHLTAKSVANEILKQNDIDKVYVCGGGVHNGFLMHCLSAYLPGVAINSTLALGVDPDYMEAMAFAWLARQRVSEQSANLPSVTGAKKMKVLGAWYRR